MPANRDPVALSGRFCHVPRDFRASKPAANPLGPDRLSAAGSSVGTRGAWASTGLVRFIPIHFIEGIQINDGHLLVGVRRRRPGPSLQRLRQPCGSGGADRKRPDARDRGGDTGRGERLSQPSIPRYRRRRFGHRRPFVVASRSACGHRLCRRLHLVGRRRVYRHEHLGARQCADGRSRPFRHCPGADHRLPLGHRHRHAGGRPGASRSRRLLCGSWCFRFRTAAHPGGAGGAQLRGVADLDIRPSRRRYFHQGRRRRRRPGGQDRGRNPRG